MSQIIKSLVLLSFAQACYAHDTNTTHPRLTESVIDLIDKLDNNKAYHQLYQRQSGYVTGQYGKAILNVLDGVCVLYNEDAPLNRLLSASGLKELN